MEDKTKLQKGVGQIKEGMGKISEGVGNIVETKVDPAPKSHEPFIKAEDALKEQRMADAVKARNPKLFEPKAATPRVPGTSPLPANAPQAWRTAQMPPSQVPPTKAEQDEANRPPGTTTTPDHSTTDKTTTPDRSNTALGSQHGPAGIKPGTPPSGQMPAPEVAAKVVEKPDPKPIPHAAHQKTKVDGIVFIPHLKKYHAEFTNTGRTLNVGNFDTLAEAEKALNKEKAEYNL